MSKFITVEGINSKVGAFQISWDGNCVWINSVSCIARYGKAQGELYYSESNSGDCVTKELFSDWQRRVLDLFDIDVPNEACPDWHIVKVQNEILPKGWSFGNEDEEFFDAFHGEAVAMVFSKDIPWQVIQAAALKLKGIQNGQT